MVFACSQREPVHLEVLGRPECLRLLGSVPLGRIAFTVNAMPAVQPVNFVLDDDRVVIPTRLGSTLETAARDAIVAFEADAYDGNAHTGWSVTVIGPASAATGPDRLARLASLPLPRWAVAGCERFILISIAIVHGRRIQAP